MSDQPNLTDHNDKNDEHDRLVARKINDLILACNRASNELFEGRINPMVRDQTIADKMAILHNRAQGARESSDTTDTIDRDVEYYFWGRWLIANNRSGLDILEAVTGIDTKKWRVRNERTLPELLGIEAFGLVSAPLYQGAKGLAKGIYTVKDHFTDRHEADHVFSSDGKPTSSAGGIDWFYTGMADGESDPGAATLVDVKYYFPPGPGWPSSV